MGQGATFRNRPFQLPSLCRSRLQKNKGCHVETKRKGAGFFTMRLDLVFDSFKNLRCAFGGGACLSRLF